MSLSYHLTTMPWAKVLSKAREMGYKSHQARTCGLRIHVNRTAFGDTEKEQDEVIARILYFIKKNWDELKVASRRTARQLEQWCNRIGFQNQPKELLDAAKKNYRVALNLCNADTVEFRIFRGILRYNTFAATLRRRYFHALCRY